MSDKNSVLHENAIIVIAYSSTPSSDDISSFEQCLKVLFRHPIHLVYPLTLDISKYEELALKHNISLHLTPFPDAHFESVKTYSRLLLTAGFYERFLQYKYILIYQLDAWVFSDELEYWSGAGYDYIGAPFFEGHGLSTAKSPFLPYAGNGGFSLRRVAAFVDLLHKKVPYQYNISSTKNDDTPAPSPENIFINVSVMSIFMDLPINEDIFFAEYGPTLEPNFKVAPPAKSIAFSFEINPRVLFILNNRKLPFGCHAFKKYDWDFWTDKIVLAE